MKQSGAWLTALALENLGRFPLGQKVRYIGRAFKRHTIG